MNKKRSPSPLADVPRKFLRKSIAGTFLPKQYYINIVLTRWLSGPAAAAAAATYFQHVLLGLSLGVVECIADTL